MNQRILKYRAWDEIDEEWKYSGYPNMPMWQFWENVELGDYKNVCEFTGLHDKNGKEIYEGDLLGVYRTQGVTDVIGEVIFDTDFAMYICKYTNGGWAYLWEHLNNKQNIGREIIGNIWESPELLK